MFLLLSIIVKVSHFRKVAESIWNKSRFILLQIVEDTRRNILNESYLIYLISYEFFFF